jgi:hypothetical protein
VITWEGTAYSRVEPSGCLFVLFSIEHYGRLGMPAMKLLHDLGDEAASPGTIFTRASFVAGALRELSIGLGQLCHEPGKRRVSCSYDRSVELH